MNTMVSKKWHIYLAIAVIIIIALLFLRDTVARFVWDTFEWGNVAIVLNEKDALLTTEIGYHYFGEGAYNIEIAKNAFEETLEIDPNVSGVLYQLGRIDFLEGRFAEAHRKFSKYISSSDSSSDVYHIPALYMKALTYGFQKRFSESEQGFLELIELNKTAFNPRGWAYYVDLAWVYFQEGRYEDIRTITKEGLELYPHNAWILNMHGVALLNLGVKDEAARVLGEALSQAEKLTEEEWGMAYPGNDPRVAQIGLMEMLHTIKTNVALAVGN